MNQVFIKIQLISHTDKVIRLSRICTDDSVIAKLWDIVFNRSLLHVIIEFKTCVLAVQEEASCYSEYCQDVSIL